MDSTIQITCTKCSRTFSVQAEQTSGFCLHCGEPFTLPADQPVPGGSAFAANRIKELYSEYIKDMEGLSMEKPRTLVETLLGRDSFGVDPVHAKYRDRIREAIGNLCKAAASETEENHCAEICRLLLLDKDVSSQTIYWPLVACEQLSEPLFPYMTIEQLDQVLTEYTRINPSNRSLPNQIAIKKAMEKAIREKGGEAPKFGLFSGRKKS